MPDATQPSSTPSHRALLAAASIVIAAAGAGLVAFGAHADTGAYPRALAVEAATNAAASATLNANDPLVQAAAGAQEVAKSAGLRASLVGAWRVVWEKSWPFIKSMTLKFFGLFGQAWRAIAGAFRSGASVNANASVNGAVNANAAADVNAAVNAP